MSIYFPAKYTVAVMMFFCQQSFGMNQLQLVDLHSELPLDIYPIVFRYLDAKASFQQTCKAFNIIGSIKSADFTNTMYRVDNGQHMVRIFLNAIYARNYKGVENILKNLDFLHHTEDLFSCCYTIERINDRNVVLDSYYIAHHNRDIRMQELLKTHCIVASSPEKNDYCKPGELIMASLAGNSPLIQLCLVKDEKDRKNALKIAIDCDHGNCVKELLSNQAYFDYIANSGKYKSFNARANAIFDVHFFKSVSRLLDQTLFMNACIQKKINALEQLLVINHFDINKHFYFSENNDALGYPTLLEEMQALAHEDCGYEAVVLLLKKYGAKTRLDFDVDKQKEEEAHRCNFSESCIIF